MTLDLKRIKSYLRKDKILLYKNYIIGAGLLLVLLIVVLWFFNRPVQTLNSAQQNAVLTIPAMGGLPDLEQAMQSNSRLRKRIKQLLEVDEAALFSNYQTIDNIVTEILFLWIGLSEKEMRDAGKQKSAEIFIRRYYGAPADEPIRNNPYFGDRPWYDLFQKIKAKILMQGQGHKLFDGIAYYNSRKDQMVIEGGLSLSYLESLYNFIQTQPADKRRGYINNYLFFIDNTLGLNHLNKEEREAIKRFRR